MGTNSIIHNLQASAGVIAFGAVLMAVICFILAILASLRLRALEARWKMAFRNSAGNSIEEAISSRLVVVEGMDQRVRSLEGHALQTDAQLAQCLQRIGVVRYDAYDDLGGQQSLSLAIMDNADNGIVITSVLGRQSQRTYAKKIVKGRSDSPLSPEEKQAIVDAFGKQSSAT